MDKLVLLKRNVPVTTSKLISESVNLQHHTVTKLIQTHEKRLEKLGRVRFEIDTLDTKGGKQETKNYYLNEKQATALVTFMKNTDIVADFKVELVKQFYEMKDFIEERHSAEWQDYRKESKDYNKEMNDIIKEYVEYAKLSGSINSNRYYTLYSNLVNGFTGIESKSRDLSDKKKLRNITIIMEIVQATIQQGISEQIHYKEIYKKCKEQLENFIKCFPMSAR